MRIELFKNALKGIGVVIILICIVAWSSYHRSKLSAEALVGDTLKYFQLSKAEVVLLPSEDNQIAWLFRFSFPNAFDEEFSIYTSLYGNIKITNPKDLGNRLRRFEKLDTHPYDYEKLQKRKQ